MKSTDATARAVQTSVEALINSFEEDPEFTARLTQLTDTMRRQRDLAERHHVRGPEGVIPAVVSGGKLGP